MRRTNTVINKNIGPEKSLNVHFSGYTLMKIQRKYAKFSHQPDGSRGQLIYVTLNKGTNGLGVSLSGDKDRFEMDHLMHFKIVFHQPTT